MWRSVVNRLGGRLLVFVDEWDPHLADFFVRLLAPSSESLLQGLKEQGYEYYAAFWNAKYNRVASHKVLGFETGLVHIHRVAHLASSAVIAGASGY